MSLVDAMFSPAIGDPNGKGVHIKCTDVHTLSRTYREVTISVGGDEVAIVWYDEPIFREDASIEKALQDVAIALGARVSHSKVTRDERNQEVHDGEDA